MRKRSLGVVLAVPFLALTGALVSSGTAGASTLTCTNTAGATSGPIGCGGLQSVFTAKGLQDISATGNFSNAKIVTSLDNESTSSQDFTVYPVNGSTTDGQGSLGEYVAMFTPDGRIPGAPAGDFNPSDGTKSLEFCISVQNVNTTVAGQPATRWFAVLRNCWSGRTSFEGPNGAAPGAVFSPNNYQVWEPVAGNGGLEFVNKGLTTPAGRHGTGGTGNVNFVLDIRADGGPGTQLIAYPEHGSPANEVWQVLGCTQPVTSLPGVDNLCP